MLNSQEVAKYNDIRATFVTTQGEINFYLYPEAAPLTVANFVTWLKEDIMIILKYTVL